MALLLWSTPAFAADPEFEGVAKEEPPPEEEEEVKPETDLMLEFGGALGGGNSVYWIINGRTFGSHKWSRNKFGFELGSNLGASKVDSDGDGKLSDVERAAGYVESTRRYSGRARYDRFLADKDSLYVLVGGFSDRYAGMDLRANAQVGYSRFFIDNDKTKLNAEIGIDVAREDYIDGIDPNNALIVAGRVLVGFSHKITENVVLGEQVEVYENLDNLEDLRVNNTLQLSVKVSDALSLKASHALIFDNVPVEGFQKADQTAMLMVSVTLF